MNLRIGRRENHPVSSFFCFIVKKWTKNSNLEKRELFILFFSSVLVRLKKFEFIVELWFFFFVLRRRRIKNESEKYKELNSKKFFYPCHIEFFFRCSKVKKEKKRFKLLEDIFHLRPQTWVTFFLKA